MSSGQSKASPHQEVTHQRQKDSMKHTNLSHICAIAHPSKDNFEKELKEDKFHLEELFKSECESVLRAQSTRKSPPVVMPWKELHSQTDFDKGFRPLDHVLLDKTVACVIGICSLDKEDNDTRHTCGMSEANDMQDCFPSRHPRTSKHCKLAIDDLRCPSSF